MQSLNPCQHRIVTEQHPDPEDLRSIALARVGTDYLTPTFMLLGTTEFARVFFRHASGLGWLFIKSMYL
jgi:hypothetical protein